MPLETGELSTTLQPLPERLRQALIDQLQCTHFSGYLNKPSQTPEALAPQLLELAKFFSVAPISGFRVGAIAIGTSGRLYLGANVEFKGMPLNTSIHAEQSAILNAWGHGETSIQRLIISELPCGHCRQFLLELSCPAKLIIQVDALSYTLDELLPHAFGQQRDPEHGLLDSTRKQLAPIGSLTDELVEHAVSAAERSYSPYSNSPQGFAIQCDNGHIYTGRSVESVAFNPSIAAVSGALNQLNLSADRNQPILACAAAGLIEAPSGQTPLADALIGSITSAPIHHVLMRHC